MRGHADLSLPRKRRRAGGAHRRGGRLRGLRGPGALRCGRRGFDCSRGAAARRRGLLGDAVRPRRQPRLLAAFGGGRAHERAGGRRRVRPGHVLQVRRVGLPSPRGGLPACRVGGATRRGCWRPRASRCGVAAPRVGASAGRRSRAEEIPAAQASPRSLAGARGRGGGRGAATPRAGSLASRLALLEARVSETAGARDAGGGGAAPAAAAAPAERPCGGDGQPVRKKQPPTSADDSDPAGLMPGARTATGGRHSKVAARPAWDPGASQANDVLRPRSGATEHFLMHRDVLGLRRRGRWTQLSTLDRYLQEGVLLTRARALPDRVRRLAQLAVLLLQGPAFMPPPPLHHNH